MQKWDYRDETVKESKGYDWQVEMERLGDTGWECYAVTNDSTDGEEKTYHFKRPKE